MNDGPLALAHRALADAVGLLAAASDTTATPDDILSALTICEGLTRRLDHVSVSRIADLQRRGTFGERGYRSPAAALVDLLGWDRGEAARRGRVADQVGPRAGQDGQALPPRLAATAQVLAAAATGLRHVETIARELGTAAAGRLAPPVWVLGFTHLCGKTKTGRFWLRRITISKRMRAKLREVNDQLKRRRHQPIPEQGRWLASVVRGHRA